MNRQQLSGRHQLEYGTTQLEYELVFTDRTTLAIHVYPDCSIIVEAPLETSLSQVAEKVRKRAKWIVKQQRTFSEYYAHQPIRMYVSGETHHYLGRQYRLKVVQDFVEKVQFQRGVIRLQVNNPLDFNRKRELMEKWYRARAKFIFNERLEQCYTRVEPLGISYPDLRIRAMKSQWGSCSPSGVITLNLKLIQLRKKYIDYVILHELCHLKVLNHSQSFYDLLGRVLPEWRQIRDELNRFEL